LIVIVYNMPQQTTNHKLLVELLAEVKKLQQQISKLKVEVNYITTKQKEDVEARKGWFF